jgi:hypothetical protein
MNDCSTVHLSKLCCNFIQLFILFVHFVCSIIQMLNVSNVSIIQNQSKHVMKIYHEQTRKQTDASKNEY